MTREEGQFVDQRLAFGEHCVYVGRGRKERRKESGSDREEEVQKDG